MEEGLIKRLMASIKCGVCGQEYELDSINILGHDEDLWFLSVLCPACHTRYLVVVVMLQWHNIGTIMHTIIVCIF